LINLLFAVPHSSQKNCFYTFGFTKKIVFFVAFGTKLFCLFLNQKKKLFCLKLRRRLSERLSELGAQTTLNIRRQATTISPLRSRRLKWEITSLSRFWDIFKVSREIGEFIAYFWVLH